MNISLEAWLTIAAIIIGPIAALLIQKRIEEVRARKNRKIRIYHDLMANRASRLSLAWVQALNAIETEFYGETQVIESWRVVLDHLNVEANKDSTSPEQWEARLMELLNDMLFEMGKSLGYHFDKVTLKRNAYYPKGWGEIEVEQHQIRKKILEVLDGRRRVPVATFEDTFPPLTDGGGKVTPIK